MTGIESVVLQLASTDLDSAGASSKRDNEMSKAKDLTRDESVRRQLPQVSAIAVKQCNSFHAFKRVLTVLTTALFHETSSAGSRDKETIQSLANEICSLICSSGGHYTQLLRSAETLLVRIKNGDVAEAFENVAPDNLKAGHALALANSKRRRKSAVEELEALAKNRARRKTAPISATGGPEQYLTLEEKDGPGVVFDRDDGENSARGEFHDGELEHEKTEYALPHINENPEKDPAATTTDRGIANEPHVESGQTGGGDGAGDTPVAVLVSGNDEEEGALISAIHAEECDPDEKSKFLKKRRYRLYGFLSLLLVASIVIVTLVTKFLTSDSDSGYAPTPSPTSVGEVAIRNQLQIVVGEDKLADESTPEAKAAHWIINEDPMQLTADSPNLIQRYVLAVFYISTTQESKWLSCNRPEVGQEASCFHKRLIDIFPFVVYEQIEWFRWLSGEHECDWAGLFCDETELVRAVELWGQEISGTLPAVFKELTHLQSISLLWNNFHGTLPKEWAELQHLLNIEVHYNWLEGEVPVEWWKSSRWAIQLLNIGANDFSGTLPTEIGDLDSLKGFFSFENQMTGTLPTELGNLKFLAFTRSGRNFLGGTLPTELGRLLNLQGMWQHRNSIEGTIPTEIGQAAALGDLRLHYNPLNGTIPFEFYSLEKLSRLDVYDCDLTGTIPTEISQMSSMEHYRVRGNNLQGTIPTEMGLLTDLKELWLHRNKFKGSIPTELCAMRSSQEDGLYVLDADCLQGTNDEGGFYDPIIFCPEGCCTRCCDGNIGICDD